MELTFDQKTVYGNVLFYPTNQLSKAVTAIAGRKTLSLNDLIKLSDAGFLVVTKYA